MQYNNCLQRIFRQNIYRRFAPGEKANIDAMRTLSNYFGNPHQKFKAIHITGTNGKGTVALKVARVLEKAGFKTGLYTNSHISSFRERMTINS